MEVEKIDKIFTYHSPNNLQNEKYISIRNSAKDFAKLINVLCPKSIELDIAIRKIQEAVMFANASIAIHND